MLGKTVLWLCNVPVSTISEELSLPATVGGGWLESLSHSVSTQVVCNFALLLFYEASIR